MSKDPEALREDRSLRNTARALFSADLAHLRGLASINSDSRRMMRLASKEAREFAGLAGEAVRRNRGKIALAGAAAVLWAARRPIMALLRRGRTRAETCGAEDGGQS